MSSKNLSAVEADPASRVENSAPGFTPHVINWGRHWGTCLKVVGYVHPVFFSPGPHFNFAWVEITAKLLRMLQDAGDECLLVTASRFARWAREEDATQLERLRVVEIDEVSLCRELSRVGTTPGGLISLTYKGGNSDHPALELLATEIAECCREFTPDVIISFGIQTDFLNAQWPEALRLHCEAGAYAHNPFPYSISIDHLGMYKHSVIGAHGARLRTIKTTPDALKLANMFRTRAAEALRATNPFDLSAARSKYRRLCLVPLQPSNHYAFDEQCGYRSQFEFLVDVLAATPADVGVIATEHLPWGPALKRGNFDDNLDYLCERFPNFIFLEKFRSYYYPSQFIVPLVDGVFSVSSSIGIQALLFSRVLGTLASTHLAGIADATTIERFFERLDTPAEPRNDFLAWQLKHYWIPERLFSKEAWLSNYLRRRHDAARTDSDPIHAFVATADMAQLQEAWIDCAPQPAAIYSPSATDMVEFMRASLESMRNSTSWRVTAPLRVAGKALRASRRLVAG